MDVNDLKHKVKNIFQELGFQRVAVGEGQKAVLRQIKRDIAECCVS